MRMRKKKNGEARLLACAAVLAEKPEEPICASGAQPIWLEIGSGKGAFARAMAARYPSVRYYAMERVSDCAMLAAEAALREAQDRPADNLRFIVDTAQNLSAWFAPGSLERIFLNFSDPWPRKGNRKRRLTYRTHLAAYFTLLREGGILAFKTDNAGLFDFTLQELCACDLAPTILTRDLHASAYNEHNIRTEYETAFSAKGFPILMLTVEKPAGYHPHFTPEKREAQIGAD